MTEFKVGDKVRDTYTGKEGVVIEFINPEGIFAHSKYAQVQIDDDPADRIYHRDEIELITPAPQEDEKDVWEWLVEQSYLSEHDGKQAKAEYEAFHKGVDALPTEVGWYESGVFPLRDGHNPYRLEWGIWHELGEDSLLETSHEEMLELMPLTKLGAEPGGEQA